MGDKNNNKTKESWDSEENFLINIEPGSLVWEVDQDHSTDKREGTVSNPSKPVRFFLASLRFVPDNTSSFKILPVPKTSPFGNFHLKRLLL